MKLLCLFAVSILSSYLYSQTVNLDSGLVASYPFNGSANDVSGNDKHGVVKGATLTTDRFGNLSSAYYFDGINDYIDLDSVFNLSSHSFSAWYKLDLSTFSPIHTLVSKLNNGPYDVMNSEIRVNEFVIGDGSSWINPVNSTISNISGVWHHIVGVYDSVTNRAKLYFDSIYVDSVSIANYVDVFKTPMYIGARPVGPSYYMKGVIDDVRIYNRALNINEVKGLYKYNPLATGFVKLNDMRATIIYVDNNWKIVSEKPIDKIQVFDITGKRFVNIATTGLKEVQIDANNFNAGIYFILVNETVFKVLR